MKGKVKEMKRKKLPKIGAKNPSNSPTGQIRNIKTKIATGTKNAIAL